jgi:hypothetical protein
MGPCDLMDEGVWSDLGSFWRAGEGVEVLGGGVEGVGAGFGGWTVASLGQNGPYVRYNRYRSYSVTG